MFLFNPSLKGAIFKQKFRLKLKIYFLIIKRLKRRKYSVANLSPQVVAIEKAKNIPFLRKNYFFSLLSMNTSCCRVVYFLIKSCFENKKKRADKTHLKWVTSARRILDDSQFRIANLYGFSQIQLYNER